MAGLKDLPSLLVKAAESVLKRDNFERYMTQAAEMIRVRTRLGYGVAQPEGKRTKLKPLSNSYKEQRGNKARYWTAPDGSVRRAPIQGGGGRHPGLAGETSPGKSNLTFTGEMVDSVTGLASRDGEGEILLRSRRKDGLSNEEVAKFVTDQGRPFLNLSDLETKRLADSIKRAIILAVEKQLNKLK